MQIDEKSLMADAEVMLCSSFESLIISVCKVNVDFVLSFRLSGHSFVVLFIIIQQLPISNAQNDQSKSIHYQ